METQGFKAMFLKMAGIEREVEWISSERVNIIMTSVLPGILSLTGLVLQVIGNNKNVFTILTDEDFINASQLMMVACTLFVLFRIKKGLLVDETKEMRLKDYFTNEAKMHSKDPENIDMAVRVTRVTVKQFYKYWVWMWSLFLVFYGWRLVFSCLAGKAVSFEQQVLKNTIDNIMDFATSTMLFAIFVVLNSVTVSKVERRVRRNGVEFSFVYVFLFGMISIFPTFYSVSLT